MCKTEREFGRGQTAILLLSLALEATLFTTSLERVLWNTSAWFVIVTTLLIASVAFAQVGGPSVTRSG
jgi:hypothetical protein